MVTLTLHWGADPNAPPPETAIIPIVFYYGMQKDSPMQYLRQSTASQTVKLGKFVDDTDGKTAETGLTIANTDILLSKAGGALAAKNSGGGTHDAGGYYAITLDATDTATVGSLLVTCSVAGALPVEKAFQVVEEAVYDAYFAASAGMAVTLAAGAVSATAIASDAITAAKLAADVTTELQSGLATAAALATVDSNVDAVLLDTAEIGAAGAGLTALASAANLATVDTVVDGIKVVTDRQANIMGTGTCDTGGSTTAVIASSITPTSIEDDQFNGRIIVFRNDTTTTALRGQASDITDYTHATLTFTVTALSEAPASGDVFDII